MDAFERHYLKYELKDIVNLNRYEFATVLIFTLNEMPEALLNKWFLDLLNFCLEVLENAPEPYSNYLELMDLEHYVFTTKEGKIINIY